MAAGSPCAMRRLSMPLFFCLLILARPESALAQAEKDTPVSQLKKMTLEELLDVRVTTLGKKDEPFFRAPAAMFVLSEEDIRRQGFLTLPESLRYVPGLSVARQNAWQWGISARGFNNPNANKQLVLIDGRSIYSPIFSGVFWDAHDTLMEDLDRIEIIRGPGGAIWGANAVNGIINFITKSARETQGLLVTGGGGTEDRGFGAVRYGGKINDQAYYRLYAKYFATDSMVLPDGSDGGDSRAFGQGGFRVDWDATSQDLITFQGDLYQGTTGQSGKDQLAASGGKDVEVAGGNFLNRWTHRFSERSDLQLQLYYDRAERKFPRLFAGEVDTFDLDAQHRVLFGERNEVVWGLGYRFVTDDLENSSLQAAGTPLLRWDPNNRATHLFSGFVQDEFKLVPERLHLTLGTKLENNDYTGFEAQPTVRLAYMPDERQTLWGAVSRAVRTPTRIDTDFQVLFPGAPGSTRGDDGLKSEKLIAYELGYRVKIKKDLLVDLAGFYNDYDELRSGQAKGSPDFDIVLANDLEGRTYGAELALKYFIRDWWNASGAYSYLFKDLDLAPGFRDPTEGSDPEHQFFLRSAFNLPGNIELDLGLRYVDRLPDTGAFAFVPSYMLLDTRLAWLPRKGLELAIVGQNLLDDQHPEIIRPGQPQREVESALYAKITWRW